MIGNNGHMSDATHGFEGVLDYLTNEILEGRVVPGDRLPNERILAAQLGASRSAVREALGIAFDGTVYPHKILRLMTHDDLDRVMPGILEISRSANFAPGIEPAAPAK